MEFLETAIVVVHLLASLALIGLVLLQQGKGAEAGASFGAGASQTVFGSQGSGNFLTRSTSWLAVVFFVTSISLAVVAKQKSEVAVRDELIVAPAVPEQVEPGADVQSTDAEAAAAGDATEAAQEVPVEPGKLELE